MWEELLQVDLLCRFQNLGQDVSGEDVWETQRIRGIPPRGIYLHRSGAALRLDATWLNLVVVLIRAGSSSRLWWNLTTVVPCRGRSTSFTSLFSNGGIPTYNRIKWWVPPCLIFSSYQSCKAGFLLLNRSWRLIPGAPSPFCLAFSWLCSRLLILPNSPFSG